MVVASLFSVSTLQLDSASIFVLYRHMQELIRWRVGCQGVCLDPERVDDYGLLLRSLPISYFDSFLWSCSVWSSPYNRFVQFPATTLNDVEVLRLCDGLRLAALIRCCVCWYFFGHMRQTGRVSLVMTFCSFFMISWRSRYLTFHRSRTKKVKNISSTVFDAIRHIVRWLCRIRLAVIQSCESELLEFDSGLGLDGAYEAIIVELPLFNDLLSLSERDTRWIGGIDAVKLKPEKSARCCQMCCLVCRWRH